MIIHSFGSPDHSVVILLAGSFCPAESLAPVYTELARDFYVIAPTYNGCHENSPAFTSRQGEAAEICTWLKKNGISSVAMVYGQSMGCEVGIELISQLLKSDITVGHGFFDGAPCACLPKPVRRIMLAIFRHFLGAMRGKTLDETMDIGLIKMMSNKDPEALKPMIAPIITILPWISDETVKNQVDCCYTFDYPRFPESMERRFHFFYGKSEKAYRLSYRSVKKAYPAADYILRAGYGHCTYLTKEPAAYFSLLRGILK